MRATRPLQNDIRSNVVAAISSVAGDSRIPEAAPQEASKAALPIIVAPNLRNHAGHALEEALGGTAPSGKPELAIRQGVNPSQRPFVRASDRLNQSQAMQ